jgi:hypothetical protein
MALSDRAILHCPFVPFSILFTHAIQHRHTIDLGRLDRFASSLRPCANRVQSITHPYQLYSLLYRVAQLYFELDIPNSPSEPPIRHPPARSIDGFGFSEFSSGMGPRSNEILLDDVDSLSQFELGDWYHRNQQIMNLLFEDVAM